MRDYRKIVIEFMCYDKMSDRDVYSVSLINNKDEVISETYTVGEGVSKAVSEMMKKKVLQK